MKRILKVLFAWTLLFPTLSTQNCENLNISLTQKVDGDGFHRELNWLVERPLSSFQCKLAIKWVVGPEIFVNPDQIEDLSRLENPFMLIDGAVDVEMPAHLAAGHTVYVFIQKSREKILFSVPFHLRYQRAQISGGFAKVFINKPSVLGICPTKCGKTEIRAPCDVSNATQCKWSNVTYQALFNEIELLVPVGNLDDYPLVSVVTLLLGCAGCIYTLSILSTTPL